MSYVYAFPFGHGKALGANLNRGLDALLGGWQMNGILALQTGMPLALSTLLTASGIHTWSN